MSHYQKLKAMKMGLASDFYTALYARSMSGSSKEYERYISGTPPLILSDSVGKPLVSWSITGNTVQDGEPTPEQPIEVKGVGDRTKNLFDSYVRNATIDSKGVITSGGDYRLYIARVTPKTVYTIKASDIVSNTSYQVYAFFKDYPKANSVSYNQSRVVPPQNKNVTVTVPENVKYIAVRYLVDDTKPQIELGSETTFYEPYGYKVTEVTRGKNLFDKSKIMRDKRIVSTTGDIGDLGNCCCSDKISVTPNTKYTLSGIGNLSVYTGHGMAFFNSNGDFINKGELTAKNSINTFTTPNDVYYVIFNATLENIDNCQLELGSTATEYEPYIEPITTPIYLNAPLMADEVLSSDDRREVEWKELVLTGDEQYSKNSTSATDCLYYSRIANDGKAHTADCYCTHLPAKSEPPTVSTIGIKARSDIIGGIIYVNFGADIMEAQQSGNTKQGLSEYIKSEYDAGHPVTIYYPLAEPTSETVDVPQIPTIKGNCVLDVDTEVKPKNMTLTYKSRR